MWPFVSKKAKAFVEDVISTSKLDWVEWNKRPRELWNKTIVEFEYDGCSLKIGEDLFGYLTGSIYFWSFNYRDRKYIWSELINEAKGIRL